jgi:hypothetical protein
MEKLKQKLQKSLEGHERKSGLHMIGGRERLVGRLLKMLDPSVHAREMRIISRRTRTGDAVNNQLSETASLHSS